MNRRASIVGILDKALLTTVLLIALVILFAQRMGNILWGAALALPVTGLILYAFWLHSRRRGKKSHAAQAAAWHLTNLMLDPYDAALGRAAKILAAHYGLSLRDTGDGRWIAEQKGKTISLRLLQRPEECVADSGAVLDFHQDLDTDYGLLISTAGFTEAAKGFARRLQSPTIRLIGPETLLPLLSTLPAPEEAVKAHSRKKKRVGWSVFLAHIRQRKRSPRYLLYGIGMLTVYIAFDQWPFLLPGLACIFLAVISKRQPAEGKNLFDE